MVQVSKARRKALHLSAVVLALALLSTGCDTATALRHEDEMAQRVGNSQQWVTGETQQQTCNDVAQTLTGIRVGRHDGFDRVVFDLSGEGTPCYRILFDPNPIQDGSGFPIDLGDNQALRVEISNLGPDFPVPPPGEEVQLDSEAVAFARFDTFFEGVATSFIAVPDGRTAEYLVDTAPGKLIVDVRVTN